MLSYKEFYFWLEGYLHGKLENKHIDITPIVEKMGQVGEIEKFGITEPYRSPIPINPFPVNPSPSDDPFYKPYEEIYCGDKTQLND
jgi:hypothetical protein